MRHNYIPFGAWSPDKEEDARLKELRLVSPACECDWGSGKNGSKEVDNVTEDEAWALWWAHVGEAAKEAGLHSVNIYDKDEQLLEGAGMNSSKAKGGGPMNLRQLIYALERVAAFIGDNEDVSIPIDGEPYNEFGDREHDFYVIKSLGHSCMGSVFISVEKQDFRSPMWYTGIQKALDARPGKRTTLAELFHLTDEEQVEFEETKMLPRDIDERVPEWRDQVYGPKWQCLNYWFDTWNGWGTDVVCKRCTERKEKYPNDEDYKNLDPNNVVPYNDTLRVELRRRYQIEEEEKMARRRAEIEAEKAAKT